MFSVVFSMVFEVLRGSDFRVFLCFFEAVFKRLSRTGFLGLWWPFGALWGPQDEILEPLGALWGVHVGSRGLPKACK